MARHNLTQGNAKNQIKSTGLHVLLTGYLQIFTGKYIIRSLQFGLRHYILYIYSYWVLVWPAQIQGRILEVSNVDFIHSPIVVCSYEVKNEYNYLCVYSNIAVCIYERGTKTLPPEFQHIITAWNPQFSGKIKQYFPHSLKKILKSKNICYSY